MKNKINYYIRVVKEASLNKLLKALDEAHIRSGKSKLYLLIDMFISMLKYGSGYNDYVIFGFWNLSHKKRDTYLTRFRNKKLLNHMNNDEYVNYFEDKYLFNKTFSQYLGRGFLDVQKSSESEIIEFFNGKDEVFLKTKGGSCGIGCEKVKVSEFESNSQLISYIKEKGFGVAEEIIKNHPEVEKVYPFAVNSLRLITVLDSSGKSHCIFSVFKMGMGGRVVDNFGLHGPVDMETGRFLYPAHSGDTTAGLHYEVHPYSNIKLIGYQVPMIKEAIEMVKKAAEVVPQVRYVGWDVAITPTGPVIIEGNFYCAHDFWQLPGQTLDGIGIIPVLEKLVPELKLR